MRNRGQLGLVFYVVIVVIVSGFILATFSPAIDSVRTDQLANTANDEVFQKLILYMLMPVIWVFYFLLSTFAIVASTREA